MKIKEITTEDIATGEQTYEQVKALVEKSCMPFLEKVGGFENAVFKNPLFRGVNFFMHDPVKTVEVAQNRKPVDTPEEIHNIINTWFLKRTGVPFRSASVFCTGDWSEARRYGSGEGHVVTVIPAGKFNYCWSPIYNDMYEDLGHYVYNIDQISGANRDKTTEFLLRNPSKLINFLVKGKYKFNTGLVQAIASKKELMINCQQAIVISQDWINENDETLQHKRGLALGALDKDFNDISDGMKY